ncbi:hypothetical protein [Pectobacterium carotovorum]|uniref:Uncharacterized protein n=1 Tax=Pectobacterium carotovorum TaxID=554 RepID=A0A419B1K0_PECCA|nr:hypothetical protein [Pectobacterium carotovorum]RJL55104.1 hypothetical protein D5071_01020 [Pectobacterium carotovorum]
MSQRIVVHGGATATIYSYDSPVVPTDAPLLTAQNYGPDEITVTTYWGAPYLDGGWHVLGSCTIPAGTQQDLYVGDSAFFHFKADATNNGSQDTEVGYSM